METINLKGKEFVIRRLQEGRSNRPRKFLKFINDIVADSEAMILTRSKQTVDDERAWLQGSMIAVKSARMVVLVAEADDAIVGLASVGNRAERADHVADFGISVKRGYRGIGLGSALLTRAIDAARTDLLPRPVMIRLSAFNANEKALSLYERHGFNIVAQIPRQFIFNGEFVDEVIMLKSLL
ncbi:MAG: GNAT family N-acetyltransferase [Candidatus Aquicultor sp.]